MPNFRIKYFSVFFLGLSVLLQAGMSFAPLKTTKNGGGEKVSDIRVLAIMAEFQTDSLDYTTGNGKFNSGYPDTLKIDGIPHDKEYFEDQIVFVKNFFEAQSGGMVTFSGYDVIDTVFTLPKPMWYYNPNNGGDVLLERLYEMYSDAWSMAKDLSWIDFSAYNTFVVFHAGSGQEFSPGYDETPFDIPSVYFSDGDLSDKLLTAHDGTAINNTIILPECEWQISEKAWYHAGMGGISCLMFAHRLGIPNLYSSKDGKSGIGKFGLMDQGSANFSGLVPSGISAWVSELKGWKEVRRLEKPEQQIVAAADSTIYRIDINKEEYFLIENRTAKNPSLNENNSITGYDRDGRTVRLFYNGKGYEDYEVEDGFKTLVRIQDNDYDFGVPARGILIWHIDGTMTTQYYIDNNIINDDHKNRGVYLEEGDGSFDIGMDYWLLDNGYGTELGWRDDAFFSGNESWTVYANSGIPSVEFSSKTYPRADTNAGTATGLRLHGFSAAGRRMTFSYSFEDPETYRILDPGIGDGHYLSAYQDLEFTGSAGDIRHFFVGTDGGYKLFDKDTLLFEGNFGVQVSARIRPFQTGDYVYAVSSDSTGLDGVSISTGAVRSFVTVSKIISQPVAGIIPCEDGLYRINEGLLVGPVSDSFKNANDLAVLTGENDVPLFVAGENEDLFFTIDMSQEPYAVETRALPSGSENYSFILTDTQDQVISAELHSFDASDKTVRLAWLDSDSDKKIEDLTSDNGSLMLKNEFGVFENGFPLATDLSKITSAFVFGENFIVTDDSYNYAMVSSDGIYDRSDIKTMSGLSNNSGLLSIEGRVYFYSFSSAGVLTYHLVGVGNIRDHLEKNRGVVRLKEFSGTGSTPPTSIVSKNVYNWPNPVRGDETNFRFFLNFPCTVTADIYDINGNRIENLKQSYSDSGEYFEMIWNVKNIPSGVYNAVLTFVSDSKEEQKLVKAAVIK
jgi:M6 family metalloprotease-like protein